MVQSGTRVFVYYNLHKKCWSVKCLDKGPNKNKVVAHFDRIMLADISFKVSQAGRCRVLLERKKNVHAGVVGTFIAGHNSKVDKIFKNLSQSKAWTEVTYNPYKYETFVYKSDESQAETHNYGWLDNKRVFAYTENR